MIYDRDKKSEINIYIDPDIDIEDIDKIYGDNRSIHDYRMFIDLTKNYGISYSDIVNYFKRFGIDKVYDLNNIDAILLIDPNHIPKNIKDLILMWRCKVALNIENIIDINNLKMILKKLHLINTYNIGIRFNNLTIQQTLIYIAAVLPNFTILNHSYIDNLKLLKLYSGASSGEIYIETCISKPNKSIENIEVMNLPQYIIKGLVIRSCD